MQVHCRLREIMQERRIQVQVLHQISGVGREAISALRSNHWHRVSRVVIGKICGALNLGLNDLFILQREDIWAAIKLSGEVTVHYGSRSLPEAQVGKADDTLLMGQYVGVWDMRAFKRITEYLKQSGFDINVSLQEHVTGAEQGADPSVHDSVRKIFENASGNHVLIGSPIAIQFNEEVVCHAFGVPPYAPHQRAAFPYGFVWDSRRAIISSFGWQGLGSEFGIWSTRTGKLVARRTMIKDGEGEDCALILVYRIFVPPARRQRPEDEERVVICILGHSGAGTLAAAQVATDPKYAAGLYPPKRGVPHMRVVKAMYFRAPSPLLRDNRVVTSAVLVNEDEGPKTAPEAGNAQPVRARRKKVGPKPSAKVRKPRRTSRFTSERSAVHTSASAPPHH